MARRAWINLQAKALSWLPPTAAELLSSMKHLPQYFGWWFHPLGRARARRILGPLEGRYRGCRCVVIGNGPSLSNMDLSVLRDEFTFGLNRIYLKYEDWGFPTTFYVAINRFVLQQFASEIYSVPGPKVLNWSYRRPELMDENTVYLETRIALKPDGRLLTGFYAGAGTVTSLALQLAYFMGFDEAILIGVDHSYSQRGVPNQAIESRRADVNHFDERYFGPGVVWQLPDLEAMERGFVKLRELFREDGRRVVDATVGGKLEVFPKVDFETRLREGGLLNRRQYKNSEEPGADSAA